MGSHRVGHDRSDLAAAAVPKFPLVTMIHVEPLDVSQQNFSPASFIKDGQKTKDEGILTIPSVY